MPAKFIFANYIVRLYRFKKDDPKGLVGVVEEAGGKGKKIFSNLEELWEILNSSTSPSPSSRPTPSRAKARGRGGGDGKEASGGKI